MPRSIRRGCGSTSCAKPESSISNSAVVNSTFGRRPRSSARVGPSRCTRTLPAISSVTFATGGPLVIPTHRSSPPGPVTSTPSTVSENCLSGFARDPVFATSPRTSCGTPGPLTSCASPGPHSSSSTPRWLAALGASRAIQPRGPGAGPPRDAEPIAENRLWSAAFRAGQPPFRRGLKTKRRAIRPVVAGDSSGQRGNRTPTAKGG